MYATDFIDLLESNTVDSTWEKCIVKCVDNKEYEKCFEIGVEYMCYRDGLTGMDGDKYIIVFDIENEKRYVPRQHFVRCGRAGNSGMSGISGSTGTIGGFFGE